MRRSRNVAVTTAVLAVIAITATACDTDDGRAMREPTDGQRAALAITAPSTTTTTTILGADLLAPTSIAPTTTSAVAPASSDGEATTLATAAPAGVVTLGAPWTDGGAIDAAYTCDGGNGAPLITWTAPPAGTAEMALAVTDDDADGFVHYLVVGLPPTAGSVGGSDALVAGTPALNDGGTTDWFGPCPPAGETHTYRLTMYLLDQQLDMPTDSPSANMVAAAGAASFAWAELTGTYQRAG